MQIKFIVNGQGIDNACRECAWFTGSSMVDAGVLQKLPVSLTLPHVQGGARLGVGMDIVQISKIQDSWNHFGARFLDRLFTQGEQAYANEVSLLRNERLAARFAAKEAALKALNLANAGVNWRDIEVCRRPDGSCHLGLHGRAAVLTQHIDSNQLALSMSHDGDYATAVVICIAPAP